MYSDTSIGNINFGQENQDSKFSKLWYKIKNILPELIALPSNIKKLKIKANKLITRANNIGATTITRSIKTSKNKLNKIESVAQEIKNKIDKYLPEWEKKSGEKIVKESGFFYSWDGNRINDAPEDGLGIVATIIISVAGLAALSYITIKGFGIIKDYKYEQRVINSVEKKLITLEEAKGLIKEKKEPGFIERITGDGIISKVVDVFSPIFITVILAGIGYGYYSYKKK